MKHPVLKPTIATGLIAVAGVLAWLFWMGDPCLGTAIANHWTEKNPPVVAPPPASPTDGVYVENPYGIRTCHYWPKTTDNVLSIAVFAIVCFAIGWLAARRIPHRPLFAAAAITTVAMMIALALQAWAWWENLSVESLGFTLLALLVFFLMASGIATLGAWMAMRWTRRA